MQKAVSCLVVLGFTQTAQAWWANGHMITAQIALDELAQRAPHVKARAETLLTALSNSKWED
jgi:hypothetical protein